MRIVYIALFGILGIFCRYYLGLGLSRILSPPFPYGTFFINVTGAFAIGVVYVLGAERASIPSDLLTGIVVGFLGGYTTFSSYCMEAVRLLLEKEYFYASLYFMVSPFIGFLSVLFGIRLTRFLVGG